MRTATTTKSKTTVCAKRTKTPARVKNVNEYGENLADYVTAERFMADLRKEVNKRYERK